MTPLVYTFDDMHSLLALASRQALRNRLRMMEAQGFPPALPGLPRRWSKPAVDHWFAVWGGGTTAAITHDTDTLRRTLAAAYGTGVQ